MHVYVYILGSFYSTVSIWLIQRSLVLDLTLLDIFQYSNIGAIDGCWGREMVLFKRLPMSQQLVLYLCTHRQWVLWPALDSPEFWDLSALDSVPLDLPMLIWEFQLSSVFYICFPASKFFDAIFSTTLWTVNLYLKKKRTREPVLLLHFWDISNALLELCEFTFLFHWLWCLQWTGSQDCGCRITT